MAQTVALDWEAFFRGEVRERPKAHPAAPVVPDILPAAAAGALATMALARPETVMAAAMSAKIMHAFSPLISALQALSYPVSFLGMGTGMLLISVGQRHRGISMIKWAAIGYIGMQLVPGIMEMVAQVGEAMK